MALNHPLLSGHLRGCPVRPALAMSRGPNEGPLLKARTRSSALNGRTPPLCARVGETGSVNLCKEFLESRCPAAASGGRAEQYKNYEPDE